jgi:AcrR family transcriptional regulator
MPKIVDHAQRRRDLLEATADVIATEGLQAATVRRIARHASCTTGLVTHYFPDKEGLVIGALGLEHQKAAERMAASARRVWLSFWGIAWTSLALSQEHRNRYGLWRSAVRHLLGEAARLGETRPGLDLSLEADRLVALVDGLGLQACYEPGVLPPARVLAVIDAELVRLALLPAPGSVGVPLGPDSRCDG